MRDSQGSIGDCEIGVGVRGPAAGPLDYLLVRSYAPPREGARRLESPRLTGPARAALLAQGKGMQAWRMGPIVWIL